MYVVMYDVWCNNVWIMLSEEAWSKLFIMISTIQKCACMYIRVR